MSLQRASVLCWQSAFLPMDIHALSSRRRTEGHRSFQPEFVEKGHLAQWLNLMPLFALIQRPTEEQRKERKQGDGGLASSFKINNPQSCIKPSQGSTVLCLKQNPSNEPHRFPESKRGVMQYWVAIISIKTLGNFKT